MKCKVTFRRSHVEAMSEIESWRWWEQMDGTLTVTFAVDDIDETLNHGRLARIELELLRRITTYEAWSGEDSLTLTKKRCTSNEAFATLQVLASFCIVPELDVPWERANT